LRSQVLDSTNSVGLHSTLLPIDPEKRLLLEYIGSEDCMNPQLFYKLSEKLVIAGDLEEALKMLDEHVLSAFPSANKTPPIGLGHLKDSSSVDRRENFTDFLLQLLIKKAFNALEFDRKINK
jgi:hypothetical protein